MSRDGYWPKYDARVYIDDNGPMSSGFTLVRREDTHKVPGCLSNGYVPSGIEAGEIEWADEELLREVVRLRAENAELKKRLGETPD